jgi:hypothetical protein
MPQYGRLVAVILEVSDLDRSAALYRNAFGIDFHPGDNGVDDRWTGGRHAEISWREGAYLHFALYPAKEQPTSGVQVTLSVEKHRRCSRGSRTCRRTRPSRTTCGTLGP